MEQFQFAERLARERRRCGLTQDQVAAHLGVTKAAVSKWERGASLPDMAQMPKIASLFAVSLDDLFGYEPQLSSAEATAWYVEVLAQFADDPATAFRRCGEMAVRYWSCVEVLFYIGMALYGQVPQTTGGADRPVQGDAADYAELAARCFGRVRALARRAEEGGLAVEGIFEGAGSQVARASETAPALRSVVQRTVEAEAVVLQWLGRVSEAVALLEPLVPDGPSLASTVLAGIYREQGEDERAECTLQRALVFSLVDAECALTGLVAARQHDVAALEPVAQVVESLCANDGVASLNPSLLPSVRYAYAAALARGGEQERALGALRRFADALDASWGDGSAGPWASLFDKTSDVLWSGEQADYPEQRAKAVAALRQQYGLRLAADPCWDGLRDDERFVALTSRVTEDDVREGTWNVR